jgi:hypothetical protein
VAIALTLSRKRLWLILKAIDAQIVAEEARYARDPTEDDAKGDFGNDLHNLRLQRTELATLYDADANTATDYQVWSDPEDNSLSLLRFQDVKQSRDQGQLSNRAVLRYNFIANTGEEAASIRNLREGWAPYLPMGDAAPCPKCGAMFYPEGYGDCWRCGHIG